MMTRFTAGVLLLGWAAAVAYPLGLLLTATPADLAALRTAFVALPYLQLVWHAHPVGAPQLQQLAQLLGLASLGLAGLGLGLLWVGWPHR